MRHSLLIPVALAVAMPLHAQGVTLDQVGWLAGCWELNGATRRVVERWSPSDSGLTGWSRTWINGAPRESERLRLFVRGDTLVYRADPSGQRVTEFHATDARGQEVVFANPAHDFPQRIIYTRVGPDSMVARIEGERGGRARSLSYPFRRVACAPDVTP